MLDLIEQVLLKEKPDGLLVYGDTNSTIAGALAAGKLLVPVFHVEAGLRSYNMQMPEEQNRVLTDHISQLLLCPTQTAVVNLKKEGIIDGVINVGDIMYDAVLKNIDISNVKYSGGKWLEEIKKDNSFAGKLNVTEKGYYLATIHRQENTEDAKKLKDIFTALELFDKPVIIPLHPRTKKFLAMQSISLKNTIIINPVGYLMMLYLTSHAYMVVTDSGGLQKEAYFLKTPCTTIRDQTEWVETLDNGWNVLSAANVEEIIAKSTRDLTCLNTPQPMHFGDGNATYKICDAVKRVEN